MGRTACTELQCLYKGDLYLYLAEVLWAVTVCSSETNCQSFVFCAEGMWYRGSSVGIATRYGLEGQGIESRSGQDFPHTSRPAQGAHPASCTMGTGSFPGIKSGRGVTLTPHPLLVPLGMKEYSYTSTPPMGRTACTEPQCLYKGALHLTTTRLTALYTSKIQHYSVASCVI